MKVRPGTVTVAREIPRFNSHFNYHPRKGRHEVPEGESETVPGEARTIKELVERLELGVPLPDKKPQFMDADLDQVDHFFQQALDLTDYDELNDKITGVREYIRQAQEEQRKSYEAYQKDQADKQRKAEIDEAIRQSKLNNNG